MASGIISAGTQAPRRYHPLRDCEGEPFDLLGTCHNVPTGAYFEHFGLFPLPVSEFLSSVDRRLFRMPCNCVLYGCCDIGGYITGREQWRVYSCCNQGGRSLQSLARGVLLRDIFEKCVRGTRYDSMFPFYRQELSKLGTRYMYYVGSVYYSGVHLIYFTNFVGVSGQHLERLANMVDVNIYLGEGLDDQCVIIPCRECATLREDTVSNCLRRTKELIMCFLTCLPWNCHYYCGIFSRRDRMIERVIRGEPVCTRTFTSWCFNDLQSPPRRRSARLQSRRSRRYVRS